MTTHITLTDRQQSILDFIRERIEAGLPPTVREIGARFDIRSPNGVVCNLKALQKKGFIEVEATARGIHLAGTLSLVLDGEVARKVREDAGSFGRTPSEFVTWVLDRYYAEGRKGS